MGVRARRGYGMARFTWTFVFVLLAVGTGAVPTHRTSASGVTPTSVLGWSPGVSRGLAPRTPLTIIFNRAMDRASVERAWTVAPALPGTFTWNGTAVTFTPQRSFRSGTTYHVMVTTEARGVDGVPLSAPYTIVFSSGDPLRVQSYSPWQGTTGVPVHGLIAVTFNHPMVALAGLGTRTPDPPGWNVSISPRLRGHGNWLGTSTWVFHPDAGLQPSTRYTVSLDGRARDAWGQSLGGDLRWSFQTILPEITAVSPGGGSRFVDPRRSVTVTFNQLMDRASAERAFSLNSAGVPVPGTFAWNGTILSFQPRGQLSAGKVYSVAVAGTARSVNAAASLHRATHWHFRAAPRPAIVASTPREGGIAYAAGSGLDIAPDGLSYAYSASLSFSAPMSQSSLDHHLTISPALPRMGTWFDGPNGGRFVYTVYGDFKPSTHYAITIGARAHDRFGRTLPGPYTMHFRTSRLWPTVALYGMPGRREGISFSAGRIVGAPVQFVNIPSVRYTLVHTTLKALHSCCASVTAVPAGQIVRRWSEIVPHPLNAVQNRSVRLAQKDGSPLLPGLYWLSAVAPSNTPGLRPGGDVPASWEIVLATNVSITLKRGGNGLLVWLTSAQTGNPLPGARVRLIDYNTSVRASATTNAQGIHFFHHVDNAGSLIAVVDTGGLFGMAAESWTASVVPSPPIRASALPTLRPQPAPPTNGTYLYTDRPIYRPGQRVHFRALLWQDRDGVYSLFGPRRATVQAWAPNGRSLYNSRAVLDRFGAVHGSFALPSTAATGSGGISVNLPNSTGVTGFFTVAEYRKPEFLASVTAGKGEYVQGETAAVNVDVRYVFGTPAVHRRVTWVAYGQPLLQTPPGWDSYTFFDVQSLWGQVQLPGNGGQSPFGAQLAQGSGVTNGSGRLTVRLPVDLAKQATDRTLTIEATVTDVNGQPVSGRVQLPEYRSSLAVGLAAQHEVVPAGGPASIDVVAVQHDGKPVAGTSLLASIYRRTYTSRLVNDGSGHTMWEAVPHDTLVGTQKVQADTAGKATVTFTPAEGGEYRVSVQGVDDRGNGAATTFTIYASAAGFTDWGSSDNTSIALKTDRTTYTVGETAHVLVTAPFEGATALVTLERGTIRKVWVEHLATNSSSVDVPVTLDDVPNVFVTVTLYHGRNGNNPPDWRYGAAELHVRLDPRHLIVHLTQNGYRHHPRDLVTYTVSTTDAKGHPVSAELSLALVDTAVLALQDESNADILSALYAERSLDVSTASDGVLSIDHLGAAPDFLIQPPPRSLRFPAPAPIQASAGGGGGGPQLSVTVRSNFADTAYWSGRVMTDTRGQATLHLTLPDNATTWRLDARGVTAQQGVGRAQLRTLATQDLVLRPLVPRFLSEGDTLHVGAVLNNNLGRTVRARISVVASGLTIAAGASTVTVPGHGERLLLWPARVPLSTAARLTIRADSLSPGVRGDAIRLSLPVHPPLTDETVATAGQVYGSAQQLVVVPRNAVSQHGDLMVQISAALTGGLGAALTDFRPQPYEANEDVANRVLAAGSLRSLPLSITGLAPRTYHQLPSTVAAGVQKLLDHQYPDGGWPWFNDDLVPSDLEITADVLQALHASGENGPLVRQAIARGRQYVLNGLSSVAPGEKAHLLLVLALSGSPPGKMADRLYNQSVQRSHLEPGALSDLGRVLGAAGARAKAQTIVSVLDSRAVVSATGAHWENNAWDYWSGPTVATTAEVLGALLSLDSRDPFVPAAARWLMLARVGSAWDCPHDSAEAIAVLSAYARAAGEGQADYRYSVVLNGAVKTNGRYTTGNQRQVSTTRVPVSRLDRRRTNALVIARGQDNGAFGPGPLYYVTRLRYYLPAASIAPRAEGIQVSRRYLDLSGHPITGIATGSALQVVLTVHTDSSLFYLNVQDPIPAGCEPIDGSLKTSRQGLVPSTTGAQDTTIQDLSNYLNHTDLRDDRVSLYALFLPPGTYTYTYLAQATVPGVYGTPPTRASESFFPEVFGRGGGQTFSVR